MAKVKSPTEKQIALAEEIANALDLEFPISSKQFTRSAYSKFIKDNLDEYRWIYEDPIANDHEMLLYLCANDVWCEHY